MDSGGTRRERVHAPGYPQLRRSKEGDGEFHALDNGTHEGSRVFREHNNGFDWQFINWYLWHFTGGNLFGHSSKGMVKDMFQNFKHLRETAHTHDPVDDARGNAEALLAMKTMGLKIAL